MQFGSCVRQGVLLKMTEEATSAPQTWTPNQWADFWRYSIGVNVLPAISKDKKPSVNWIGWQNKPIPEDIHNRCKEQGAFSSGIAIVLGKVWHREDKKGLYFIHIDLDKKASIDEFCIGN